MMVTNLHMMESDVTTFHLNTLYAEHQLSGILGYSEILQIIHAEIHRLFLSHFLGILDSHIRLRDIKIWVRSVRNV